MKRLQFLAGMAAAATLCGCGSSVRTVSQPTDAPKNSFNQVIKDNPNIPDNAKKAMLGNTAGK